MIGKTIKHVTHGEWGETLVLHFTDGTHAALHPTGYEVGGIEVEPLTGTEWRLQCARRQGQRERYRVTRLARAGGWKPTPVKLTGIAALIRDAYEAEIRDFMKLTSRMMYGGTT